MYTLRKKWLPHEPDTEKTLAQAVWLEKKYWEDMSSAMTNGTARAFTG
ncbi:DUF6890 family protein [Vibrio sp. TRT 21S02]|nr:conserved hypothetical protein [Vibrio aestuarianus]